MARKKRKDEKEDTYEWVPPEFDEKAFLEKDMIGTKALLVTTLIAAVFGLIAFGVGQVATNYVGFIAYLAGGILLNQLYKMSKIDPAIIDKKLMIGNIALYFLLAMGIWILVMNEPFM